MLTPIQIMRLADALNDPQVKSASMMYAIHTVGVLSQKDSHVSIELIYKELLNDKEFINLPEDIKLCVLIHIAQKFITLKKVTAQSDLSNN